MCTGAEIPLILSAVGAGTGAYNNYQTAKRQDKANAAGIRAISAKQRDANNRVNAEIDATANADVGAAKQKSLDGFLTALRNSKDVTQGGLTTPVPNANVRFAENVEAGKQRINEQGAKGADLASSINAPITLRQREAGRRSETAGDLREIGRQVEGADNIRRMDVAGQTPNAFLSALSTALQVAGGATGAAGTFAAPKAISTAGLSGPFAAPAAGNPFLASLKAAGAGSKPYLNIPGIN